MMEPPGRIGVKADVPILFPRAAQVRAYDAEPARVWLMRARVRKVERPPLREGVGCCGGPVPLLQLRRSQTPSMIV
jgi:hypothetical protein